MAYYIADNALNNDTALHLLQSDIDVTPYQQRLRCTAHVINLVCKAILCGTDTDCLNEVIYHAEHDMDSELHNSKVSAFE